MAKTLEADRFGRTRMSRRQFLVGSSAVVVAAYDREAFTHEIYFELTLPGSLDDEQNAEILEQLTNSFQASFDDTKASRS